jgi:hypothetical protein
MYARIYKINERLSKNNSCDIKNHLKFRFNFCFFFIQPCVNF